MAKENLFYSGGSKELASKRKALSCFKGRFISGRSPAYLLFNIFMAHESRIVRQAIKTWQQQQYSCQPPRSQFVRILPQLDMQAFDWHLTRFHARPVWVVRCSKDIGVFGVVIAVLLCCNHFQVKYRFPFLSARCCVWQINWLPSSEALQTVHLLLLFLMHCLFPSLLDPRFPLPSSHFSPQEGLKISLIKIFNFNWLNMKPAVAAMLLALIWTQSSSCNYSSRNAWCWIEFRLLR